MRPVPLTVQQLTYNCEVFTNLVMKKYEFLKYDVLTLACSIIMASRKICKLQEYWPDELVAMSGDRLRQPQLKKCMRHITSFYDDISCSGTNTQQSSPSVHNHQSDQKTVKRTNVAQISTKKKSRPDLNRVDKSQEQTTSKKVPVSVTRMLTSANQSQNQTQATTNISVVNQSKTTDTVVTPAKSGMPRNTKGAANVKSSCDKYQKKQGSSG